MKTTKHKIKLNCPFFNITNISLRVKPLKSHKFLLQHKSTYLCVEQTPKSRQCIIYKTKPYTYTIQK